MNLIMAVDGKTDWWDQPTTSLFDDYWWIS